MTIEESDNPGGTFQFENDIAIFVQVSVNERNINNLALGTLLKNV